MKKLKRTLSQSIKRLSVHDDDNAELSYQSAVSPETTTGVGILVGGGIDRTGYPISHRISLPATKNSLTNLYNISCTNCSDDYANTHTHSGSMCRPSHGNNLSVHNSVDFGNYLSDGGVISSNDVNNSTGAPPPRMQHKHHSSSNSFIESYYNNSNHNLDPTAAQYVYYPPQRQYSNAATTANAAVYHQPPPPHSHSGHYTTSQDLNNPPHHPTHIQTQTQFQSPGYLHYSTLPPNSNNMGAHMGVHESGQSGYNDVNTANGGSNTNCSSNKPPLPPQSRKKQSSQPQNESQIGSSGGSSKSKVPLVSSLSRKLSNHALKSKRASSIADIFSIRRKRSTSNLDQETINRNRPVKAIQKPRSAHEDLFNGVCSNPEDNIFNIHDSHYWTMNRTANGVRPMASSHPGLNLHSTTSTGIPMPSYQTIQQHQHAPHPHNSHFDSTAAYYNNNCNTISHRGDTSVGDAGSYTKLKPHPSSFSNGAKLIPAANNYHHPIHTSGASIGASSSLALSKSINSVNRDSNAFIHNHNSSSSEFTPVRYRPRKTRSGIESDFRNRHSMPLFCSMPNFIPNGGKYGKIENYKRLEVLGEGSYATVYKGVSLLSGTEVALKEIRLNEEEGAPFTAIREASLLRELVHANIVKLHDIIYNTKQLIFVFEYLCTDLNHYLERYGNGGLNPHNIKLFLFQLLRGLSFIHARKILHRDLKPQNLLISQHGELKLADFGLARAKSVPTQSYSNEVVTLWYRPPDILLGSTQYSTQLDMWGVGCIFCEMVSGLPTFPGVKDPRDQLLKIFRVLGTPDETSWPGVTELPLFKDFKKYKKQSLERFMPKMMLIPYAEELAQSLLKCNPSERISANESMQSMYFKNLPQILFKLPDEHSIMYVEGVSLEAEREAPRNLMKTYYN